MRLTSSYRDYGLSRPRLSLDGSGSISWRKATFEGGAGAARAGIFGDLVNVWISAEFPLPGALTMMVGADYNRWNPDASPYLSFMVDEDHETAPWQFTFSVRRPIVVRLPFVR